MAVQLPTEDETGELLDLDSVHRRIDPNDGQGSGQVRYGRRLSHDGATAVEPSGAGPKVANALVAARVAFPETVRDTGPEVNLSRVRARAAQVPRSPRALLRTDSPSSTIDRDGHFRRIEPFDHPVVP
ncbi:hypothetical protein [Streptomyces sp. ERV7]|uniref:hypothetical protein n=1 Tax=Streptomyces sp. ERV7 TaxID=1322334 RepID=UPI00131BDDF1|nr:hypothetical protein [Streptomyces sp. ERV7]